MYLKGWEVVFKVSPHGKLPDPNEDDYYNINPMTYEGVFYQEQHDDDDVVRNDDTRALGDDDVDSNGDDARIDPSLSQRTSTSMTSAQSQSLFQERQSVSIFPLIFIAHFIFRI